MSQLFLSAGVFPWVKVGGAMKVEWEDRAVLTKAGPAGAADIYLADIIFLLAHNLPQRFTSCVSRLIFRRDLAQPFKNVVPEIANNNLMKTLKL